MSIESCYVRLDGPFLIAGNSFIERRWEIRQGQLFASRITDKVSNRQWIVGKAPAASMTPPTPWLLKEPQISMTDKRGIWKAGEAESLVADITVREGSATFIYRIQIFTDLAAINTQIILPEMPEQTAQAVESRNETASGIEADPPASKGTKSYDNIIDCIPFEPSGFTLAQIELHDQTDQYNTLLHERRWMLHPSERTLSQSGNLFYLENNLTGDGLAWIKHAPLPHARPLRNEGPDLLVENGAIYLRGHGTAGGEGYMMSLLAYQNGKTGRTRALHELQRHHRQLNDQRDVRIISNTWGDRNRDSRVCESFLIKEIEAGAKLGIEVTQIDDGWQKGRSANSATAGGVWNGFWAADPEFWEAHKERFPNGLRPVIEAAKAKAMQIGLWYAPDSSNEFQNWRRDVEQLLNLHNEYSVCYFKIDGVKATTKLSERRLLNMFDQVVKESSGKVSFDLDVTAEIRPGYFGAMHAGPLFVENRYTDWHNYYPHATLRNLWMLSQVIDPWRLRMEFLNPHRNAQAYANEKLAPSSYDIDYLFATIMMSNPLAWMEISSLPEEDIQKLAPLVCTWKQHRAAMMHNITQPIGDEPNGASWTGFLNYGKQSAYLLIFRECNSRERWSFELPSGRASGAEILAGNGNAECRDRQINVYIPEEKQFIWMKLKGFSS